MASTTTNTPPAMSAHLRVGRPTSNINALRKFYIDGLGFSILYEFTNHNGFDGLILGHPGVGYHLEFTTNLDHQEESETRAPSEDNLLVFYLPDGAEWKAAVEGMEAQGFDAVKPANPYWEDRGKTFEDADGYRIVFQNAAWENEKVRQRWLETLK